MTGLIVFLLVVCLFYLYVYRSWKNKTKRNFKIVICCISLAFTLMLLCVCIGSARDLYEDEMDRSIAGRMHTVTFDLSRNDYKYAAFNLKYYHDYEEDFEYAWERCEMHMARNRYELYRGAAENDAAYQEKADFWLTKLKGLCSDPEYKENQMYGEYFLKSVQ